MNDPLPPAYFDGQRWSDDNPVTDREKHDFCRRRTGANAVVLHSAQYEAAEHAGLDMRWYVRSTVMPTCSHSVLTRGQPVPYAREIPMHPYAIGRNFTMTWTRSDGTEITHRGSIMSDEQLRARQRKEP